MMAVNTFRKFRWFWAWEDDREEDWLREMSNQGNHLKSVGYPGFYTFEEGEKKDYVYRLDYTSHVSRNDDYYNLFRDAGWFFMGEMNSWQYFRKEASNTKSNEIYTDSESKIEKYKRLLYLLLGVSPITIVNVVNLANLRHPTAAVIGSFINAIFLGFLGFGIYRLLMRIRAVKNL